MSAPLVEGALFAGRYRIVRMIAQGGMGAVYEVIHTETNRRRALKVMHPHIFESDELRERFKREARVAADIESDHIIDVSDAGIDEVSRTPFMVMEFLRGEELGKRIKRIGPLPFAEVLIYLRQTALALDKTHAASIVHRDLKPDNLFLTHSDEGSPRVKILDFGVAKVVAEGATGQGTQSLGTPLYMAPEQFYPNARVTPAVDIFAFGLVAYTLLVGVPYWRPESTAAGGLVPFITMAIHGPKAPPVERAATLGVNLPCSFDEWFFRATAFKPEARFGLASEAVVALEKVFEHVSLADLLVTAPLVRAPAASVPAFASTPGTFVPTAIPGYVEPATPDSPLPNQSLEPRFQRRTPLIVGGVAISVLGLSLMVWNALRTPAPTPASESLALPLVSAARETAIVAPGPVPEPSPSTVVTPTSMPVVEVATASPQVPTRADDKLKKDKPSPISAVTTAPTPAPAPAPQATTKKSGKGDLLGQD